MALLDRLWPLFGLELAVEDLVLRVPDDALVAELAELTREPIHDAETMPFSQPWTDQPEEERVRGTLQWHWRARAEWTPEAWTLNLVAIRGERVVGTQMIRAVRFAVVREVDTGSWVGRRYQRSGVGTLMRRAVLHLAFAGLGARSARSGAFVDNAASLRVSEKLGYSRDGTETLARRGEPAEMIRLVISRERWAETLPGGPPVGVEGLEACMALFGAPPGRS